MILLVRDGLDLEDESNYEAILDYADTIHIEDEVES